jgi:nitrogen fixation protein NifZ
MMHDIRLPIFQWGQPVRVLEDIVNDGSHPDFAPDELMVAGGTVGEIANVGHHEESNSPVYLVEFGGRLVVGCFEHELEAA